MSYKCSKNIENSIAYWVWVFTRNVPNNHDNRSTGTKKWKSIINHIISKCISIFADSISKKMKRNPKFRHMSHVTIKLLSTKITLTKAYYMLSNIFLLPKTLMPFDIPMVDWYLLRQIPPIEEQWKKNPKFCYRARPKYFIRYWRTISRQ